MNKFLFLLILSLSLFSSCQTFKKELQSVSVTSSSSLTVKADTASFTIKAEAIKETSEDARKESNSIINNAINVLKTEFNVKDSNLESGAMSINPYYEWIDGKRVLSGQNATLSVNVEVNDLEKIGIIYDRLSFVNGLSISPVTLTKKDISSELAEVRKLAVKEAKKKANAYAEGLGLSLGDVITISDTQSNNQPMMARTLKAEANDSSSYYVSELTLTDEVSVTFTLEAD